MKELERLSKQALKRELDKGFKPLNEQTICCMPESIENEKAQYISRSSINLIDYIPSKDDPITFICVNLHVFQDSTGQKNYNESHIKGFREIFDWINASYQNIYEPNYIGVCNSKPVLEQKIDTRIRFVLNRIEFYQDDALCNLGAWDYTPLVNAMLQRDASMNSQLNIFLTDPDNPQPALGYTRFPSSNLSFKQYIHSFRNRLNPIPPYFLSQHWAHELGHVLGLTHTYNGGGASPICDENDPFYIYDIHGCSPTKQCPIPKPSLNNNNLMGGQESWTITTLQAAVMHYSLQNLSVGQYANKGCCFKCVAFSGQGDNHVSFGTDKLLNYPNTISNEGWSWNGSEFITPVDGIYNFSISFVKDTFYHGGTQDDVHIILFKNELSIGHAWSGEGSGRRSTGSFQVNIKLKRGDKVFTQIHSDSKKKRHVAYYVFNGHLICSNCI
ncbi:C1q-like domain-containing protein [Pseudotenacibaculum haliotis]|uniref:C1q domain-containing protein n=1 Tax=Pseudotenacibaculum haliotis TaxID=1862138 RepID=A0ABW5LM14_9FLAO